MIARRLATAVCLISLGALFGCSAAAPEPSPSITATAVALVPSDGVLLRTLGYQFAPADLSVPASAAITERVDQENTVVAVFTAPDGLEIAAYLRKTLPAAGWDVTADDNNSLLFERGEEVGAFTITGAYSALSIRWDERS